VDSKYSIINTNIACGKNYSGIVTNKNGELVGIVTSNYEDIYGDSLINAYGVSDLEILIEQLINSKPVIYFGIEGREVDDKMQSEYHMPKGIYITQVKGSSPAYEGGIQVGDVITKIDNTEIENFLQFQLKIFSYKGNDEIKVTLSRNLNGTFKEFEYKIIVREN